MKIKIHNDGKEKVMSFEASLEHQHLGLGFGETEEEAINDLKVGVETLLKELQNLDYSQIEYVDCFGNPLKKRENSAKA